MCPRNFCELCKECLRRRALFEKSDNHRQQVKGLGPDFPVRAGQFFGPMRRLLFGSARPNALAASPLRACASQKDYDAERFGVCNSGTTEAREQSVVVYACS